MAAVKKLLVRTPLTKDGITLVYDENRQPRFKETLVEPWARKQIESLNSSMAEHLRHELKEVLVEQAVKSVVKAPKLAYTLIEEAPAAPAAPAEEIDPPAAPAAKAKGRAIV